MQSTEIVHHDGADFYIKTWQPEQKLLASVVFIHGFAEHVDRYDHVFKRFSDNGIRVVAFDQRGFGKTASPKHNGLTGDWAQVMSDLEWFVDLEIKRDLHVPIFIYGHSMVDRNAKKHFRPLKLLIGQRALIYASTGKARSKLSGAVLSAPMIRTAKPPPWLKLHAGRILANIVPNLTTTSGIKTIDLSRDAAVVKAADDDPLLHDTGSLITFRNMLDKLCLHVLRRETTNVRSGEDILNTNKYSRVDCPVLLAHGTADKLTSYTASKEFFENRLKCPDKTFKAFEGYYHEGHNEIGDDKIIFIDTFKDWILARL